MAIQTSEYRRKMMLAAIVVVLANSIDLISTWVASPDLANEWNVLQRIFGLGWIGLFVAKFLGGALAIYGYSYYLRHRDACYPPAGGAPLDREAFCRHFSFGKQVGWVEMRMGIPFGQHLGVNLGYLWVGMQLLVFWVALENFLLHYDIVFPLRAYTETGYHMLQSAIVAGIVLNRFYRGNYLRYRRGLVPAVAVVVERSPSKAAPIGVTS